MQKDMIEILNGYGFKLQEVELPNLGGLENQKEQREKVYRIEDSDRLIFLIELDHIKNKDLEQYVNMLLDWTHQNISEGEDFVERYQEISMKMILWDMYVIFVSCISETVEGLQKEEIYHLQRNSHFMKRYVVQDCSKEKIAEKVRFIVRPEHTMDGFVNKLEYISNEDENCRRMSHTEKDQVFGAEFNGETYQKILAVLDKINDENFGENRNEDTGS